MRLENWKELFEAIGLIAIVASLIFVGIELRQSRAIAIGDGNLANAQLQIDSNNAISEHSIVWTRGNSGETLAEHNAVIFRNLVKNKAIHAFMEYARLDQLEFSEAADSVTAQFAIFLLHNPGALEAWQESEGFLASRFDVPISHETWRDDVLANLAKLEREVTQ